MGSYGNEEIEDCGLLGLVGRELQLTEEGEDGCTVRDHLVSRWRQTGEKDPLLEPIKIAEEVKYLWEYWVSMHRRRDSGEAISHQEIYSWSQLRGIRLLPFELKALDAMEGVYWKITNERLRAKLAKK